MGCKSYERNAEGDNLMGCRSCERNVEADNFLPAWPSTQNRYSKPADSCLHQKEIVCY